MHNGIFKHSDGSLEFPHTIYAIVDINPKPDIHATIHATNRAIAQLYEIAHENGLRPTLNNIRIRQDQDEETGARSVTALAEVHEHRHPINTQGER